MSLSSSLYIGVSGLQTSQNALNTTAHNLANVNTSGYTRQQVLQADRNYYKWGVTATSTLQTGRGVDVETVRQVRDYFKDLSYRQEVGRKGYYEAQSDAVDEVEGLFGELEGVTFQDTISDLWSTIEELTKTPDADEVRASVVEKSQSFLERAQSIYDQLQQYQENLNTEIQDQVDRVNEIADQIYELNTKICTYESNGVENANDLRDERNALLDELSAIISITYKEDSNGVVTVSAEGMPLVSEDRTYKMGTAKVSDSSNLLKPVWTSLGGMDVYDLSKIPATENNTDIGYLKGLLISRGSDTANYTDIPVKDNYATEADYNAAMKEYNTYVNTSSIMTIQAQLDNLVHGIVTAINDALCPNTTMTLYDGSVITVLDEANAPMDVNSTSGTELFSRKATDRYTTQSVEVSAGVFVTVQVYNEEDPSDVTSLYTLDQLIINPTVSSDYTTIPLNSSAGTGDVDQKTAEKLSAIWDEDFTTTAPDSLTGCTFMEYYTSFTGELATRGNELASQIANQTTLVSNIDSERQAAMGVSSDEELTNLIKFQHAYNASSRYINAINEMMETIISRLG